MEPRIAVGIMDTSGLGIGPLEACPGCGATGLVPVSDGEVVNFLCGSCGRCWHVTLGRAVRVDPLTCPGCPHRAQCLARAGTP